MRRAEENSELNSLKGINGESIWRSSEKIGESFE
jgi:hypothetical protein